MTTDFIVNRSAAKTVGEPRLSHFGRRVNSCRRMFRQVFVLGSTRSRFKALLNRAGEFLLPFQLDHRIIACHAHRRVARDLAGFDGTPALLLTHRDVRAPERMQAEAKEVTADVNSSDLQGLPHS